MKNLLLLFILFFTGITKQQAQGWDWMKPLGYNDDIYSNNQLYKSPSGNLLITNVSDVAASYKSELIYCNLLGDTLWKKSYPNLAIEDVTFDEEENVYFSGNFINTLAIGGISLTSNGIRDAIVVKLFSNGNYQNHITFGTSSSETASTLTFHNNSLFVAGGFPTSFYHDGFSFTANGKQRTFIMKLNPGLQLLKAFQSDSSAGACEGLRIRADESGSVYLLGSGDQQIQVGGVLLEIYDTGQFLAKFSEELELKWANVIINHFMYGYFLRSIVFDKYHHPQLLQVMGGGGGSYHSVKLSRFDTLGTITSSKVAPMNFAGYISIDMDDNVWIAGQETPFWGPCKFSICKIKPDNTIETVIYDTLLKHPIRGIALDNAGGFYILGKNVQDCYLGPYSCSEDAVGFLAHYGQMTATDIAVVASAEEMFIYPNPSPGIYILEMDEQLRQNAKTVCVYDASGRCIYNQVATNDGKHEIDITGAGKGVYFVEVETTETSVADRKRQKCKLIKKIVLN